MTSSSRHHGIPPTPPRFFVYQRSIPPDGSAAGSYAFDLCMALVGQGCEVHLTGIRTSRAVPHSEVQKGLKIRRIWTGSHRSTSLLQRAASLPLTHTAFLFNASRIPPRSVLVTTSDPPLACVWASFMAKTRNLHHIHWCQDLYPETAAAAGLLPEKSLLFRLLRLASRNAMKNATATLVVGRCMKAKLWDVPSLLVENWANIPMGSPRRSTDESGQFLVLYSGNLGRTHEFNGLLGAARIAAEQGAPHHYVIAGSGPRIKEVSQAAASIPTVSLMPPVPYENLAEHLAGAHAHIITLQEAFGGLVVPSRLYDACASGRPVIFVGPKKAEAAFAIRENNMGVAVPPNDPHSLFHAVESLRKNPHLQAEAGENALHFAAKPRRAFAVSTFMDIAQRPFKNKT